MLLLLSLEYVINEKVEYVIIVEIQNPWWSKVVETFIWHLTCLLDAYRSTFHSILWFRTSSDPANHLQKQNTFWLANWHFRKSFLGILKENNEYWTHKVKFCNIFSKTSISLCLYHNYDNDLHMKKYVQILNLLIHQIHYF